MLELRQQSQYQVKKLYEMAGNFAAELLYSEWS